MELSEISFKVNTSALTDAATKAKELGTAVAGLSKDFEHLKKVSADASKAQADANLTNAKAEAVFAKSAEDKAKAVEKSNKSVANQAVNIDKVKESLAKATVAQTGFVDSIERKRDLISEGWTRGESSILKTAESLGIIGAEMQRLKSLLSDIGGLAANPFDSTLGSLRSIQKEFDGLTLRSKLVSEGIELSSTQLKQYSRIAAEAAVAVKKVGLDPTSNEGLAMYNTLLKDSQDEYLKVAVAAKQLQDAERGLAKEHRATAAAKAFLAKEEDRVKFVTEQMNAGTLRSISISDKAASAVNNYKRNLQLAGVAGEEAATKLAKYTKAQDAIMQREQQRVAGNLARALQPQATDVVVSLWSGQNPLTVLLQQGGQIVDLFKQSGLEVNKLGETMKSSLKGMLPSIVAVGSAMGGLVLDGTKALGSAVLETGKKYLGFNAAADLAKKAVIGISGDFDSATVNIEKLNKAFSILTAFTGVAVVALIGTLISFGVALKQAIAEESAFSKAMVLTGGSMGMTTDMAYGLAKSVEGMGATVSKNMLALTGIAKEGNVASESLKEVMQAAVALDSVGGQAIEATVKQFNKLAKEPTEGLAELARQTGMITPEVLQLVKALEQSGNKADAAAVATKAYAQAMKDAAIQIETEMGVLQTVMHEIYKNAVKMWDAIVGAGRKTLTVENLNAAEEELKTRLREGKKWYQLTDGAYAEEITKLTEIRNSIKSRLNQEKEVGDTLNRNSSIAGFQTDHAKALNKELSKTQQFNQKIVEIEAARTKMIKDGVDKEKADALAASALAGYKRLILGEDKKPKQTEADKEKARLQNYYNKLVEEAKDLTEKYSGSVDQLSKAQLRMIDLINDKDFLKLTPALQAERLAALAAAHAHGVMSDEVKLERQQVQKLIDDYNKLQAARDKAVFDTLETSDATTAAIKQESEALILQAALIGKTDEERKRALKTNEANLELTKELLRISKLDSTNNEDSIRNLKANAYQQYADRVKNINTEIAIDQSTKLVDELKKVSSDISSVLADAMFNGGKDGARKIRDILKAKLMEPITLIVNAVVNTALGSVLGGITGGAIGQVSGGLNVLSGAGTLGKAALGWTGLSGATTAGMAANTAIGTSLGFTAAESAAAAGAAGASAAGSTIGEALSMAFDPITLGIAGLIAVFSSLDDSGTFHTGGAGAYSAKTGAILGTEIEKQLAFNLEGYTTQATIEASANISRSIAVMLDKTAATFGKDAGYYAATAFADDTSKDGAWGALMIKLGDKILTDWGTGTDKWPGREFGDAQQGVADYAKALAQDVRTVLDNMGLPDWAKTLLNNLGNAPSIEQIDQVVITISQIQSAIEFFGDTLGYTVANVTELVNIFGDASAAMQQMQSFYENFYPEQERVAILTRQMTTSFAKLGLELPKSRDAFRAMVDTAVAAGDSQLVANLLLLQQGIVTLNPVIETAANNLNSAYDGLKSFYEKLVDDLKQVGTTLKDYLVNLRLGALSPSTPMQKYATAKQSYEQAINLSKTATTDEARLEAFRAIPAASTALLEASRLVYGSSEQYNKDFASVEQSIGSAVTDTEYQITLAEDNLTELKKAVIGITGIETAVLSVKGTFDNALLSYFGTQGAENISNDALESVIKTAYETVLGREADTSGLQWWKEALKSGTRQESSLYTDLAQGALTTNDAYAASQYLGMTLPTLTQQGISSIQATVDNTELVAEIKVLNSRILQLEETVTNTALANIAATDNNTEVIAQVITDTTATATYTNALIERTAIK